MADTANVLLGLYGGKVGVGRDLAERSLAHGLHHEGVVQEVVSDLDLPAERRALLEEQLEIPQRAAGLPSTSDNSIQVLMPTQ